MSLAKRGMAIPKEVRAAIEKDRQQKAYLLAVKGFTPRQIAELLSREFDTHISRQQVVKDLAKALDENSDDLRDLIRREVMMQLARLDDLYAEVMSEFQRSKLDIESVTTREYYPKKKAKAGQDEGKQADDEQNKRTLTEKNVTGRLGDPRYISEARQILTQRLKLLGLDKEETIRVQIEQYTQQNLNVSVQQALLSPDDAREMLALYKQFGIGLDGQPLDIIDVAGEPAGLLQQHTAEDEQVPPRLEADAEAGAVPQPQVP